MRVNTLKRIDPQHLHFARSLRRQQTDAERILWNRIRKLQLDGIKFRRQHSIGNYIVDFVSLDRKLIIEIDGGQHNEQLNESRDEQRTKWLEDKGYKVLRFWNNDILTNIDGVFLAIMEEVNSPSS